MSLSPLRRTEPARIDIPRASFPGRTAPEEPGVYRTAADALDTLGRRLALAGKRDRALTVSREAVAMHRRLAEADPADFGPGPAEALHGLAAQLPAADRDEALALAEEAVVILRAYANGDPATHQPGLAGSLHLYGGLLVRADERDRGLEVIRDVVERYRSLAEATPGRFDTSLARSPSDLGEGLGDARRYEEALTAHEAAVDVYQKQAQLLDDLGH
ncbi:tetratricopeptide repeat protein [Streptomyces niveus]|uniref:tetratricopeptide repeat protein n=1 Tax=Streptomyces niveus TaxID=193462 RepID=UPI0035DA5F5D